MTNLLGVSLFLLISFNHINSRCEIINSKQKGKLIISRSENPKSFCIGKITFENKETGKKFCLNRNRQDVDLEKLTCDGCNCGAENKPVKKVVGGQYTGKNQHPWYALLFVMIPTIDSASKHKGGQPLCGGSLITEKVVLSAAHCVEAKELNASDYLIGLGMYDISGFKDWTSEDFRKHVIMEVEEIIIHEGYSKSMFYDVSLLILKERARFSFEVSPVCLPKKEEIDILEKENNIVVGFGTTHIWFIVYNTLLGGNLKSASLISPELISNKSALIWGFTEGNLEKEIIDGYFENFIDLFPGIEICIENYDFVCNITEDIMKTIIRNMEMKIMNSGSNIENYNVPAFLEVTHELILKKYAEVVNEWTKIKSEPVYKKLFIGTDWLSMLNLEMEEILKIRRKIKFVNQWLFIRLTFDIVKTGVQHASKLKMARGKFVPWSEANKWNDEDPTLQMLENPSTILVQRSGMKDGYACHGDSGGPLVVKHDGRFVLVASVSRGPAINMIMSWPPPCYCTCGILPEIHMRVSSVLPWIDEHLTERNLKSPCKR